MERNEKAHQVNDPRRDPSALERENEQLVLQLRERVKELTTMQAAMRLLQDRALPTRDLLQGFVDAIPPGFLHSKLCFARVQWGELDVRTQGYRETPWRLDEVIEAAGRTGRLTVLYRKETPPADEGPFLREEVALLHTLSTFLTRYLDHAEALEALRRSEERYALAARAAADGLWDWDLQTDQVYCSPRWQQIVGEDPEPVTRDSKDWFHKVHPEDLPALEEAIRRHRRGQTEHMEIEFRILHRAGFYRWVLCRGASAFDERGEAQRMAGSLADVTDRRLAEDQLLHDAFHDSLTALPNRALMADRLTRLLNRLHRRREYNFALIFLDLDRFKTINDSLGHLAGDQLLVTVARRLEKVVRPTDTVARFAGDEFTILLDDLTEPRDATLVAERIQAEIRKPVALEGREVVTTCSMGIVLGSASYARPEDLLRDADTALYRAKALGRGQFQLFDQEMHEAVLALLNTETDLQHAIDHEQFRVFYHPIHSLETRRIVRLEALVRWQHPTRGMLRPGEFLPVAVDSGIMPEICLRVVRQACAQAMKWRSIGLPPFGLNINLSGVIISCPSTIGRIIKAVAETGLEPADVGFEVTETVLMENQDMAAAQLQRLRQRGHLIVMDDFGTGLSSLSYLHRFPIDRVKIDKSFFASIEESPRNREFVRAIVALCHALEIDVTAEGIETAGQLQAAIDTGCRYAQGYHFGLPADAEEIEGRLRAGL